MTRPDIPIPDSPEFPYPIIVTNTPVIPGFGRGSTDLGFPTANVSPDSNPRLAELPTGVYFGFIKVIRSEADNLPPVKIVSRMDGKSKVQLSYGVGLKNEDFAILPMVFSLGWNPYYGNKEKTCELHVMHKFSANFYGAKVSFSVLGYIRPELDYVNIEALVNDINTDIKIALEYLQKETYLKYKKDLQ